jgi:dTDP-4-amino-4,6-dideoxygalactose transaminase
VKPKPEYVGNPKADWMLKHIVYLPITAELSREDMQMLSNKIIDVGVRYLTYTQEAQKR